MTTPVYRIVQEFVKVQAIGTSGARQGDPADPVALEVVLTRGGDLSHEVERVRAGHTTTAKLRRLRTGSWLYEIPEAQLDIGISYTARWRYEMTPGNVNVVHTSFVWQPIPAVPADATNVILYGLLTDAQGAPLPGQRLVFETYEDPATLTRRTGQLQIVSDAFGIWMLECPKNTVYRIIFNELTRVVQVKTDRARVALSELPPYQPPSELQLDKYGYPLP